MKKVDSVAIARLAGVSRSTVSKVINDYPNIAVETRARVLKAIEERGFTGPVSLKLALAQCPP